MVGRLTPARFAAVPRLMAGMFTTVQMNLRELCTVKRGRGKPLGGSMWPAAQTRDLTPTG